MLRTTLIAGLLLIAPEAWAQNTITPGQWAEDVGLAKGPQSTGADAAMGYGSSTASCGPEAWSTDAMSYASLPSCGGVTGAALDRDLGNTDPVVAPTSANATSSSSMLHQQMKELETAAPPPQAVLAETYAVMTNAPACNPAAVAITDEYGFKYNCLGYRIR